MENRKKLEKILYFFVPYNISEIQKGIQAGHAALEYAQEYSTDEEYLNFIDNWKTWIILDGGTTNNSSDNPGTLQQIRKELFDFNSDSLDEINFSTFKEPDLNDALTAICFICDERVFNYQEYPAFPDWIMYHDIIDEDEKLRSFVDLRIREKDEIIKMFPKMYPLWVEEMGGPKNVFLRELLEDKELA